ncbi:MAG: hypothetical protein ACFE91_16475 [Promethearchaeota archaeon]
MKESRAILLVGVNLAISSSKPKRFVIAVKILVLPALSRPQKDNLFVIKNHQISIFKKSLLNYSILRTINK